MKQMKPTTYRISACLLFTLLLQTAGFSFHSPQDGQATDRAARKIDEYKHKDQRSESEQMHLWAAFDELVKEPEDSRLFIIAYGNLPGTARRHANRARNYLLNAHAVNPARVAAVDGGYRAETSIEIWLVPSGAQEPMPKPNGGFEQNKDAAWKYDEYSLDGWWFSGNYEQEPERLDGFAAALQSNPQSKGYIVVSRGTMECETCLKPGTELRFAKGERAYLIKTRQIAPARSTIIKSDKADGGKIELWVVPNGANFPKVKI
ncbi:MAG TPA: hypothetical protein VGX92_03475 [Pyrinomonadaceae bacterium]|jgi:hypothetical protein|nr:hypothetical protein [Pyrinomonadaceae bacterium]